MLKSDTVKLIGLFFGLGSIGMCMFMHVYVSVCVHMYVVYMKVRGQCQDTCTLSSSLFFKDRISH